MPVNDHTLHLNRSHLQRNLSYCTLFSRRHIKIPCSVLITRADERHKEGPDDLDTGVLRGSQYLRNRGHGLHGQSADRETALVLSGHTGHLPADAAEEEHEHRRPAAQDADAAGAYVIYRIEPIKASASCGCLRTESVVSFSRVHVCGLWVR